jgi:hypothetical protein
LTPVFPLLSVAFCGISCDIFGDLIFDATAKRAQTAENAEITQRFSGFFLGELRASSANSAVKEVFAGESKIERG